jgi:ketosteroid isomerase-like protein
LEVVVHALTGGVVRSKRNDAAMSPAEFMNEYEAVTNAHALDVLLELIADDAIYLFSNQMTHVGKPAIRKAIRANFEAIEGETYRTRNLKWLANSNEVAACIYEFEWSGIMNGRPVSGHGRGTTVIRRVDGQWRVAHEHLSSGGLD